jgi:adenosylcobinamide-phosphate synthase
MQTALIMLAALAADALLGEIRRGHPLAGFGTVAAWLERRCNRQFLPAWLRRSLGVLALLVLVLPLVFIAGMLAAAPWGPVFDLLVLYLALGLRSLGDHARSVERALAADELDNARIAVGMMVSRDTRRLDRRGVSAAAVESVLENGSDAVFGSLFWFAVAGAPGVVLHRLVNTLDAMWGYRTRRLADFGWCAARFDDVLNWIPARLTAFTYAVLSIRPLHALACSGRQGGRTESPDAGVVMAAGAGALGVRLGGPGVYHGRVRRRPRFGTGAAPDATTIRRARRLVQRGAFLWVLVILVTGWSLA